MNDHDLIHQHAPDDDELAAHDAIKLTELDTAALIQLIDHFDTDLGSVDTDADYPEQAEHLRDLRRRLAELHGEPRPRLTPEDLHSMFIGNIDVDDPGTDSYFRLRVKGDFPATQREVEAAFLQCVYQECSHPGGRFCRLVTVTEVPHSGGMQWLAIAHNRLDV